MLLQYSDDRGADNRGQHVPKHIRGPRGMGPAATAFSNRFIPMEV
jgi:hypothetical protein